MTIGVDSVVADSRSRDAAHVPCPWMELLDRWFPAVSNHPRGLLYLTSALAFLATLLVHPYPHLHDVAHLLSAFERPWVDVLPPERHFLYGSPLVLWLGYVFDVDSRAGLWGLGIAMWLLGFTGVVAVIARSGLSSREQLRFFAALFSGFTLACLREWLTKSDVFVLVGLLLVFFAEGRKTWWMTGAALAGLAHHEQALTLLGFTWLLSWNAPQRRRDVTCALTLALAVIATHRGGLLWSGFRPGRSRLAWLFEVGQARVTGLMTGDLDAILEVTGCLVSLAGIGWWFVIREIRGSTPGGRGRMVLVLVLALALACAAKDLVRVSTVLGWPALMVSAKNWSRSGEPLLPGLPAHLARWFAAMFWTLWFVKLG